MISNKIKIFLYLLLTIINGGLQVFFVKNLFLNSQISFVELSIGISTVCIGAGYFLNFIQARFIDKKVEETLVLDYESKVKSSISANQLWPFKLGFIFSLVLLIWMALFSNKLI